MHGGTTGGVQALLWPTDGCVSDGALLAHVAGVRLVQLSAFERSGAALSRSQRSCGGHFAAAVRLVFARSRAYAAYGQVGENDRLTALRQGERRGERERLSVLSERC